MSEAISTIGKLLTDAENYRDAVHIAIAPVTVEFSTYPGVRVGLKEQGNDLIVTPKTRPHIGILDPFLDPSVKIEPGKKCWLFLFPSTITGLHHHWSHPAFTELTPGTLAESQRLTKAAFASPEWLDEFAAKFNLDRHELIESAKEYAETGETHTLGFDTPSEAYTQAREMWDHIAAMVDWTIPESIKDNSIFRCAC